MTLLDAFYQWFLYGNTYLGHVETQIIYIVCWSLCIVFIFSHKKMDIYVKYFWLVGIFCLSFGLYEITWGFRYFYFVRGFSITNSLVDNFNIVTIGGVFLLFPIYFYRLRLRLRPYKITLLLSIGYLVSASLWVLAPFQYDYPSHYFPQVFIDLNGVITYLPSYRNDIIRWLNFFDKFFFTLLIVWIFRGKSDMTNRFDKGTFINHQSSIGGKVSGSGE